MGVPPRLWKPRFLHIEDTARSTTKDVPARDRAAGRYGSVHQRDLGFYGDFMWENYIGESEDPSTLAEFWRLKKTWRIESEHSSLLSF